MCPSAAQTFSDSVAHTWCRSTKYNHMLEYTQCECGLHVHIGASCLALLTPVLALELARVIFLMPLTYN